MLFASGLKLAVSPVRRQPAPRARAATFAALPSSPPPAVVPAPLRFPDPKELQCRRALQELQAN